MPIQEVQEYRDKLLREAKIKNDDSVYIIAYADGILDMYNFLIKEPANAMDS